jgi:hypothetical protein
MDLNFACGLCGADPATDSMLVHSAIAAVISGPFLFRAQLADVIRRVRGRPPREAVGDGDGECPLPSAEDDHPDG